VSKLKNFIFSLIFVFNVNAIKADIAFVDSSSIAADWVYFSGPSVAADWIYVSDSPSSADYTICFPREFNYTNEHIAALYILKLKAK
jgi:hypothetical protein